MKSYDYYQMKGAPIPTKTQFTKVYAYKAGKVIWQGSVAEYDAYEKGLLAAGVIEKAVDQDAFNAAMDTYRTEHNKRAEEFRTDLFEDHCVLGHPKADKCLELAWDLGHSAGHEEVASYFGTLVKLIKD